MTQAVKPLGGGPASLIPSVPYVSRVSVPSTDALTPGGKGPIALIASQGDPSQHCSSGTRGLQAWSAKCSGLGMPCRTWDAGLGMPCWSAYLEKGGSPQQGQRRGWPLSHTHWEQNNGRVCHSACVSLFGDTVWARSPRRSLRTLPGAHKTASRLFVDQRPPSHTDICWRRKTSRLSPSPCTASGSLAIELSYESQDLKGDLCCPLHRMALLQVQKKLYFAKGRWVGATKLRNGVSGKSKRCGR